MVASAGTAFAGPYTTTTVPSGRGFDAPNFERFDYSLTIQRDLDLLRRSRNIGPKTHGRKPSRKPVVTIRPGTTIGTRPSRWPTRKPVLVRKPDSKKPGGHRRPRPTIVVRIPPPPTYVPPTYIPPTYRPPTVVTYPKVPKATAPRGPVITGEPPQPKSAPSGPTVLPAVASGRYRPREVLIALPSEATTAFIGELSQTYGIEPRDSLGIGLLGVRIYRFSIRGARSVPQVVAEIQADLRVGDVQPNYVATINGQATTGSAVQYALAALHVPDALTRATGRNVTIAVIDTGVDMGHPELQGVISGSYDAVRDATPAAESHGTAIAGIIGARGNLSGVAPGARILAVRAFAPAEDGSGGETDSLTLARAIDWSASHGAAVFNMSFAGPKDPLLERLLDAAHDKGIVLVAAAGNGGPGAEAVYPGAHPAVIAVTAVDHADQLYADANRGDYVAIAAPGVNILAPAPNGSYGVTSGTSLAAAHLSGIVALALEASPGLDPQAVRDLLVATAHDLGPAGRDDEFGAGRANALDALMALGGPETTRVAGDGVAGRVTPASLGK
jgi:subtilisin family serine protease